MWCIERSHPTFQEDIQSCRTLIGELCRGRPHAKSPHVIAPTAHRHANGSLVVDTTSYVVGHNHATKLPHVYDPTTHTHSDSGLAMGAPSQVAGHNYVSKPKPTMVVHNSTQCPIDGPQPTHNQPLIISKSFQVGDSNCSNVPSYHFKLIRDPQIEYDCNQVVHLQLSPKVGWEDKIFGKKTG